jgi:hypothetical protein
MPTATIDPKSAFTAELANHINRKAISRGLAFATFRRPVAAGDFEAVSKSLLAVTVLTHMISVAEFSAIHEHREGDPRLPVISQKDSEKYRGDFVRLRKPFLADLTHRGMTVDLEAFLKEETRDFLDAARQGHPSDPCQVLVHLVDEIRLRPLHDH